jgi:uncharacterized protein YecT (DUF1311 family)
MRFLRYGLLLVSVLLIVNSRPSSASLSSSPSPQDQMELTEKACSDYKKADAEMNSIYRKVLAENKKDRLFVQKMRAAQRAWVAFRDAHLESLYPATDKRAAYGSVHPMCHCMELQTLTDERAKVLKVWLDGVGESEGDVCAGSIKIK